MPKRGKIETATYTGRAPRFSNWEDVATPLKANFSKKPAKKIFSLLGGKIEFEFYTLLFIPHGLAFFYDEAKQ